MENKRVISENQRKLKKLKEKLTFESSAKDLMQLYKIQRPCPMLASLYDISLLSELAPAETVSKLVRSFFSFVIQIREEDRCTSSRW